MALYLLLNVAWLDTAERLAAFGAFGDAQLKRGQLLSVLVHGVFQGSKSCKRTYGGFFIELTV